MVAKIHAKRGDVDGCLQCLRKAKGECYRDLATSIKTEDFRQKRKNPKLHEVVAPPITK